MPHRRVHGALRALGHGILPHVLPNATSLAAVGRIQRHHPGDVAILRADVEAPLRDAALAIQRACVLRFRAAVPARLPLVSGHYSAVGYIPDAFDEYGNL